MVAHRLSTVRYADLIVVMEHGDLIEQGTHNELITKGGVYSELVKKQQIQISSEGNNRKTKQEEEEEDEVLLRNEAIEVNRKSCIELNRASDPSTIASVSVTRKSRFSIIDGFEDKLRREKKEKKNCKKMKAPVWKVFKQMRPQWGWIVLGSVGACIAGTVFPLYALFFAKVITMLNENDDKDYGPLEGPNMYSFLFVILGMFAFLGFALQTVSFEIAGAKYTKKLRSLLFVAFMKQEIGYFDKDENNVGSLTSKLAVDAKNVNEMITRAWPDVVQIAFTSVIGKRTKKSVPTH